MVFDLFEVKYFDLLGIIEWFLVLDSVIGYLWNDNLKDSFFKNDNGVSFI